MLRKILKPTLGKFQFHNQCHYTTQFSDRFSSMTLTDEDYIKIEPLHVKNEKWEIITKNNGNLIAKFNEFSDKRDKKSFEQLFDSTRPGMPKCAPLWNAILQGLIKLDCPKRLEWMYKTMKINELQPSQFAYGLLIKSLATKGRQDDLFRYLDEMFAIYGKNSKSYLIHMNALHILNEHRKCFDVIAEWKYVEMPVDPQIISFIVSVIIKTRSGLEMLDEMLDIIIRERFHIDLPVITNFFTGFVHQKNVKGTQKMLEYLKHQGIQMSPVNYTMLMKMMTETENTALIPVIYEEAKGQRINLDFQFITSVVAGYCAGGLWRDLKAIRKEMVQGDVPSHLKTYTHLIDWYLGKNLVKDALETYKEMKSIGIVPDTVLITMIVQKLIDKKRFDEVGEISTDFTNYNIELDEIAFTVLIRIRFKLQGDLKIQGDAFWRDLMNGRAPSIRIWNAILQEYARIGNWYGFEHTKRDLDAEIHSKGEIEYNIHTFRTVVQAIFMQKQYTRLAEIRMKMQSKAFYDLMDSMKKEFPEQYPEAVRRLMIRLDKIRGDDPKHQFEYQRLI